MKSINDESSLNDFNRFLFDLYECAYNSTSEEFHTKVIRIQ